MRSPSLSLRCCCCRNFFEHNRPNSYASTVSEDPLTVDQTRQKASAKYEAARKASFKSAALDTDQKFLFRLQSPENFHTTAACIPR